MSAEVPEWLTVGATVAYLTSWSRSDSVERVRVERVGKRDASLSNGRRINATTQRQWGSNFGPSYLLLPLDDPRVLRVEAAQRRARLAATVEGHMWRFKEGDEAGATEARDALNAYLGDQS